MDSLKKMSIQNIVSDSLYYHECKKGFAFCQVQNQNFTFFKKYLWVLPFEIYKIHPFNIPFP